MSNLKENLDKLIEFARDNNFIESFSNIYFVEDKAILHLLSENLYKIPRKSIFSVEGYANRFDELFNQGHSWINMYLAGILNDSLLIIIEVPDYQNNVPREFVSVKFSLPQKRILENNWNVTPFYEIID